MSCLNITVTNMSPPLQVGAERLGGVILTVIKSSNSLNCNIFDKLIDKHLKLTCGVVCTIADIHYIRVSPSEVQWVTPDIGVVYQVTSDTDWIIE